MRFTLVVSEQKFRISFRRNFTFYKWRVTKVAHCNKLKKQITSLKQRSASIKGQFWPPKKTENCFSPISFD